MSFLEILAKVGKHVQASSSAATSEEKNDRLATLQAQHAAAAQIAQFQQQARHADRIETLDPDIADLADHFHIPEPVARRLHEVMKTRLDTFEQDVLTLWDTLGEADDPLEKLNTELGHLVTGTFVTKSENQDEMVQFCKMYKLDATASKNLIEVLIYREKEHETDIKRDLDKLAVHLEHSSAPSKLISMKLKEMRAGCNINAVWHCCGDSKKKHKDKDKDLVVDKGLGGGSFGASVDDKRSFNNKSGSMRQPQRNYSDQELEQRFNTNNARGSGQLMTEEQARNMMKKEQATAMALKMKRGSSRSRSGRRRSDSRRRSRSRPRRDEPRRGRR